jgi:hypothetical protein
VLAKGLVNLLAPQLSVLQISIKQPFKYRSGPEYIRKANVTTLQLLCTQKTVRTPTPRHGVCCRCYMLLHAPIPSARGSWSGPSSAHPLGTTALQDKQQYKQAGRQCVAREAQVCQRTAKIMLHTLECLLSTCVRAKPMHSAGLYSVTGPAAEFSTCE